MDEGRNDTAVGSVVPSRRSCEQQSTDRLMPSFSAALLTKRSARQLRRIMLEKAGEKKPGESFFVVPDKNVTKAQDKVKSPYVDMAGSLFNRVKGRENLAFSLYFSVDEIRLSRQYLNVIENKSIQDIDKDGEPARWYFESALIQTAFYTALTRRMSVMKTAAFRQQQGHPIFSVDVDRPVIGKLQFGEDLYRVSCSDEQLLIRFFFTKARAIIHSWENAGQFDSTYKHKEWEFFKSIISKRKIS